MAASLATRPILPIDESRYVGVAWEMWQRGDLVLPTLNGHPYSDKPPLLFWGIHLGWWLFGINEWWPRLVPALFGLANLALVSRMARSFWGATTETALTAPIMLLGCLGWTFFTTTLTFDMALVFGILLALLGLVEARERWSWPAWGKLGLGTGLALLAKGPVALVFVLPVVALARWWAAPRGARAWFRWYGLAAAAFFAGVAILLAWALPAAARGGKAYQDAIFFHQTADRVIAASAHPKPWWWYLVILPVMLFPFAFLPQIWGRLRTLSLEDPAIRFCLSWSIPSFLLLCVISAKQPHYLLGLLPALALVMGRSLRGWTDRVPLARLSLPLAVLGLFGLALSALPYAAANHKLPLWLGETAPTSGLIVIGTAILGLALRRWVVPRLAALSLFSAAVFLSVHVGVISVVADHYDIRPAARYLEFLERNHAQIAHVGTYHDQFHFEGRLSTSFTVLPDLAAAKTWRETHPRGHVIAYYPADQEPAALGAPEFLQPFRGRTLGIWGPLSSESRGEPQRNEP